MKGKHMKLTVNVINFFLTWDSFQNEFLMGHLSIKRVVGKGGCLDWRIGTRGVGARSTVTVLYFYIMDSVFN